MFVSVKKTAASSLDELRHKVNLQHVLAGLQPILLLQMLGGLSQAVSSGVSQTQALARTLFLSGQQRLRTLLAAPRLLPERVLASDHPGDVDPTLEKAAAQALLEVCLGLMLEWIARRARRSHIVPPLPYSQRQGSASYSSPFFAFYPLRAHLCIPVPLA